MYACTHARMRTHAYMNTSVSYSDYEREIVCGCMCVCVCLCVTEIHIDAKTRHEGFRRQRAEWRRDVEMVSATLAARARACMYGTMYVYVALCIYGTPCPRSRSVLEAYLPIISIASTLDSAASSVANGSFLLTFRFRGHTRRITLQWCRLCGNSQKGAHKKIKSEDFQK